MHHNIGRVGSAYTLQKHYLQLYVERYDFFPFPRPFIVIDYFLECFFTFTEQFNRKCIYCSVPPIFPSCIGVVHLLQLVNQIDTILLTKVHSLLEGSL